MSRIIFLATLFAVLIGVGCCAGPGENLPHGQAIIQDKKDLSVFSVHGRIIRDKTKKVFSTGWGFRSAEKDHATFFLLKTYPKEFDSNAMFMNERRAQLRLRIVDNGDGTREKPFPSEVLDVLDISRNLSGN